LCAKKDENMTHKAKIHELFGQIANEVYDFIKESEFNYDERWVPATFIKDELDLKKSSYPQENKIDNKTGWLFATIARHLEDKNKIIFKKDGNRSFYKTVS
jgi:hypothetical protein